MFVLLGLLVGAKMFFVGLLPDEEYQITMSYRLSQGDGLFNRSWDTIQTSGFLNVALIRLYLWLTGGTEGLVLFLRGCGLLIQLAVSVFFGRTLLRKGLDRAGAWTIGFAFFCTYQKLIASPDFSNMQLWFMTVMLCVLWKAYDAYRGTGKVGPAPLIVAALCLCGVILSQACFVLVPVMAAALCILFRGRRLRANLLFFGTCAVTGCLYAAGIVLKHGLDTVLTAVTGVFGGDLTHATGANLMGQSVILTYAKNTITIALYVAAITIVALALTYAAGKIRGRKCSGNSLLLLCNLFAAAVTLYHWLWQGSGYDGMKLFIPVCVLSAGVLLLGMKKEARPAQPELAIPVLGVVVGFAVFLNVLFVSNVPLTNNLCFLLSSVLWSLVLMAQLRAKEAKNTAYGIIAVVTATIFLGTLITLPSSPAGCLVSDATDRVTAGPAKGIFTSGKVAEVYNSVTAAFTKTVPQGAGVVLVTNSFENTLLDYCYLLNDVDICHYSVNSTPTFSMKLEEYWNLYPEKYPDVIAVNRSTYHVWEWDWILYYLENYYHYDRVVSTEYADFYFR